jgi:hypothetical protein
MDTQIWSSVISCIGTTMAALIAAIAAIIAARIGKEKTHEKVEQIQAAQKAPIASTPPQEHQTANAPEPRKKTTVRVTQKNKAGIILGIASILIGIILSCSTSLIGFPVIFSILAIVFGILGVITGKSWAGIIGFILNGATVSMFIIFLLMQIYYSSIK